METLSYQLICILFWGVITPFDGRRCRQYKWPSTKRRCQCNYLQLGNHQDDWDDCEFPEDWGPLDSCSHTGDRDCDLSGDPRVSGSTLQDGVDRSHRSPRKKEQGRRYFDGGWREQVTTEPSHPLQRGDRGKDIFQAASHNAQCLPPNPHSTAWLSWNDCGEAGCENDHTPVSHGTTGSPSFQRPSDSRTSHCEPAHWQGCGRAVIGGGPWPSTNPPLSSNLPPCCHSCHSFVFLDTHFYGYLSSVV